MHGRQTRAGAAESQAATGMGAMAAPFSSAQPPAASRAVPRYPSTAAHPAPDLEVGLAIKARCGDVTGSISAAGGQKYQVTGKGLICLHFYYVSNLGERKHSHEKPSQLFLGEHDSASLKA